LIVACLFFFSCCPYHGLVKPLLIATRSPRVLQSGRTRDEHSGFLLGSLSQNFTWLRGPDAHQLCRRTCLHRVAQLGRVLTENSASAACSTSWPRVHSAFRIRTSVLHSLAACCRALPCVAQLGRVCTVHFTSEACCTAWPRVAQLGHVLHSLVACCTALPRVAHLGRVLHIFAACSTSWPRVPSVFCIGAASCTA
jgi:hypothetical protein